MFRAFCNHWSKLNNLDALNTEWWSNFFRIFIPKNKEKSRLFLRNRYYLCIRGGINNVFLRDDISQSKTNRSNSDFSFIKIRVALCGTILFGKSTVQTFVTLDTSTQYTNISETILQTKPFIAFLNRNSGKNRRQKQNRESLRAREIN